MKQQAIGVFDSGLGGLTVAQALRRQLPHEHMIYLGDTARVPYGSKSPRSVRRYAIECALFLAELGIKLLVIACNTASAHAVDYLSQLFRIPVLGVILPGAQAAVSASPTGRIGVIATRSTISSNKYQEALLTLRPEAQIWAQACPLFVPLVEEGYANHSITEQIAAEALEPGIDHGIDCLLLGCTHFPLLRNTLEKILCPSIRMIDSASSCASEVHSILLAQNLEAPRDQLGSFQCYVTDDPVGFRRRAVSFLAEDIPEVQLCTLTGASLT